MAQGQTPSELTRADIERILRHLGVGPRELTKELLEKGEPQEVIRLLEIFHHFPGTEVE